MVALIAGKLYSFFSLLYRLRSAVMYYDRPRRRVCGYRRVKLTRPSTKIQVAPGVLCEGPLPAPHKFQKSSTCRR